MSQSLHCAEHETLRFAEVYRKHRAYVRRTLLRFGAPPPTVDDAVHDVFVVALRRIDDFDPDRGGMHAWLTGIAFRIACASRRRWSSRAKAVALPPPDRTSADPDRRLAWREAAVAADELARSLPQDQWTAFVLTEVEGLSGPEIARALGIPLNTVYTRLRRARAGVERWRTRQRRRWALPAWLVALVRRPAPAPLHVAAFASVRTLIAIAVLMIGAVWLAAWQRSASAESEVEASQAASEPERGVIGSWSGGTNTVADDPHALRLGRIEGRAHDDRRQSVSGATVCAWAVDAPPTSSPRQCRSTRADGSYALDGLAAGAYRVSASAPRLRAASYVLDGRTTPVRVVAGRTTADVDLLLRTGAVQVRGRVVDATGGPVEDANVLARSSDDDAWGPATVVQSDAEGMFEAWVPPGMAEWTALADGYATVSTSVSAPVDGVELRLFPASSITGVVVDPEGSPVAGARVQLVDSPRGQEVVLAETTADAQGRFALTNLEAGRYRPRARADAALGTATAAVVVGPGETANGVEVVVRPAASVVGHIAVDDGGQACNAGFVELQQRQSALNGRVPIDADQTATFAAIPRGTYDVRIDCLGLDAPFFPDALHVDGQRTTVQWHVPTGDVIRGRVVGPTGEPVAAARVRVQTTVLSTKSPSLSTDADGSFTLRGARTPLRLVATSPGFAPSQEVLISETPADVVDVMLRAGGAIEGVVVDAAGTPAAGQRVRAQGTADHQEVVSGPDGRFALWDIATGTWSLRGASDYWDAPPSTEVAVEAGVTKHVRVTLEGELGSIRGRVVDDNGEPVADARVGARAMRGRDRASALQAHRVLRSAGRSSRVISDAQGEFELKAVPDVPHMLFAVDRDGAEAWSKGHRPGEFVQVRLEPAGALQVELVAPDGAPLAATEVVVYGITRSQFRTASVGPGGDALTFSGLPSDEYEVLASSDLAWGARRIRVVADEETTTTLELKSRRSTRARVVDLHTGEPIAGARVVPAHRDASEYGLMGSGQRVVRFDRSPRSDATGQVQLLAHAPGLLGLMIVEDGTPETGPTGPVHFALAKVPPGTGPVDLGDIPVARRNADAAPGQTGITLASGPFCGTFDTPDAVPDTRIVAIAAGSPASATSLRPELQIVNIAGVNVADHRCYLAPTLLSAPAGTQITIETSDGTMETITAQAPTTPAGPR